MIERDALIAGLSEEAVAAIVAGAGAPGVLPTVRAIGRRSGETCPGRAP